MTFMTYMTFEVFMRPQRTERGVILLGTIHCGANEYIASWEAGRDATLDWRTLAVEQGSISPYAH